jgi:hypothetical protein
VVQVVQVVLLTLVLLALLVLLVLLTLLVLLVLRLLLLRYPTLPPQLPALMAARIWRSPPPWLLTPPDQVASRRSPEGDEFQTQPIAGEWCHPLVSTFHSCWRRT